MYEQEYIQVLWVENDPKIISAYPREAEMFANLQLTPVSSWEEAKSLLEKEYNEDIARLGIGIKPVRYVSKRRGKN